MVNIFTCAPSATTPPPTTTRSRVQSHRGHNSPLFQKKTPTPPIFALYGQGGQKGQACADGFHGSRRGGASLRATFRVGERGFLAISIGPLQKRHRASTRPIQPSSPRVQAVAVFGRQYGNDLRRRHHVGPWRHDRRPVHIPRRPCLCGVWVLPHPRHHSQQEQRSTLRSEHESAPL